MDNIGFDVSALSAFKTPARAYAYFELRQEDQIPQLVQEVARMRQEGRPYISLGSGTNCLFAFDFFEGLLIKSALKGWKFENNELITASGEGVSALASQLGFATLIPWVGLPGTFGGALVGNAGCFGLEAKDIVKWVRYIYLDTGEIHTYYPKQSDFQYRGSWLKGQSDILVLEVCWKRCEISPYSSYEPKDLLQLRKSKQPPGRSCGSFYRNPEGTSAGKLIDEMGYKGKFFGDLQISPLHGNFFINTKQATWKDVMNCNEFLKKQALEQRGIELHEEVKIIQSPLSAP